MEEAEAHTRIFGKQTLSVWRKYQLSTQVLLSVLLKLSMIRQLRQKAAKE